MEEHPVVSAVMADPVVQAAIVTGVGSEMPGAAEVRVDARAASVAEEAETSLRTQGQRNINLIWETTQMRLALSVIWGALIVAGTLAVFGKWLGSTDLQLAAVVFLFGVANLITGFYFGRTNHQRTGGVGGGSLSASR